MNGHGVLCMRPQAKNNMRPQARNSIRPQARKSVCLSELSFLTGQELPPCLLSSTIEKGPRAGERIIATVRIIVFSNELRQNMYNIHVHVIGPQMTPQALGPQ